MDRLIALYRRHIDRFARFSVIGAIVFLLGEAILVVGVAMGLSSSWAFFSQAVISIEVSFFANWRYVFRGGPFWKPLLKVWHENGTRRQRCGRILRTDAMRSLWRFNVSRAWMIPIDQALFMVIVWLGAHSIFAFVGMTTIAAMANVVETIIVTVINYVTSWLWAFRRPGEAGHQIVPSRAVPVLDPAARVSAAVVIPVKGRESTIRPCVVSLLEQTVLPAEIILVGDVGDSTWSAIRDLMSLGVVTVIETEVSSMGRDANPKRSVGLSYAIEHGHQMLALTDSDMVLPSHWMERGLALIEAGHKCVGGPMYGLSGGFWARYIDGNPILPKTPRMERDYLVTAANFGTQTPPITANVFFTSQAYIDTGPFDSNYTVDYEDYPFFADMVQQGISILCTHWLAAGHHHRGGFAQLVHDYFRSGWGCADFVTFKPECRMAQARVRQTVALKAVPPVGTLTLVGLVLSSYVVFGLAIAAAGYLGAAAYCVWRVRSLLATVFPLVTTVFAAAFVWGFTRGIAFHRKDLFEPTSVGTVRLYTVPAGDPPVIQPIREGVTVTTVTGHDVRVTARPPGTPAWHFAILGLMLALGAVMRFWQIGSRPGWDWDEPVYANIIGNEAVHHTITLKEQWGVNSSPWLFHPPFHFLIAGEWFRLTGVGVTQARVWGASMAMVAILLLYFALRRMTSSQLALAACGLLLIDGWMVYAARVSSIENSLMVLILLAIWFYWRAMQAPTRTKFVAAGVLVGMAVIYKFTGAYLLVAVGINWLIQRDKKLGRRHLQMIGACLAVVAIYLGVMTVVYWKGGIDWFWMDNGVQVGRTLALNGSRGSFSTFGALISPLFHQYWVFVGTIIAVAASMVLVGVRLVQCLKARSWQPVRANSVLFAWVTASIISFGSIGLKFPTYFQLLLVPMYVYLVAELGPKFGQGGRRRRMVMCAAVVVLVALGALAFNWRIVDQTSNAMGQTLAYARTNIPQNAIVVGEQPIGVMIPQQYCDLYRTAACQSRAGYIITYRSDQHPIPTNTALAQLLAHAQQVAQYRDFKQTITIWRIRR